MLASLVALAVFHSPVALTLPAGVLKYRVEVKTEVTLGKPGDEEYHHDKTEAIAFVSLEMTDTTIGRFANFTIDSMVFYGGEDAMQAGMEEPALLKNPKGAKIRFLVVKGELDGSQVPPSVIPGDPNIPLSAILPAFPAFFPGVRPDAKAGDKWADTARSPTPGVPDVITTWSTRAAEGKTLTYQGSRSIIRKTVSPQDSSVLNGKESASHLLTTSPFGPVTSVDTQNTMEGLITGGETPKDGIPLKTSNSLKVTQLKTGK